MWCFSFPSSAFHFSRRASSSADIGRVEPVTAMQKKSLEAFFYSVGGVSFMALILVLVNFITSGMRQRVDLTKERAYTLSAGTRAILAKLDTPVKIRFYCTQAESSTPDTIYLKGYAKRV